MAPERPLSRARAGDSCGHPCLAPHSRHRHPAARPADCAADRGPEGAARTAAGHPAAAPASSAAGQANPQPATPGAGHDAGTTTGHCRYPGGGRPGRRRPRTRATPAGRRRTRGIRPGAGRRGPLQRRLPEQSRAEIPADVAATGRRGQGTAQGSGHGRRSGGSGRTGEKQQFRAPRR